MKQFLLTSFLLLKGILMIGQGVAGTTSANGVNIIFQDGFSGTSVVATTFTSTTDWVKTNATGSPAAAAINTSWSYNTSSTHCLRQVLANNTGAYLWSPQFTLPATSSGKAFLRYAVKNTSLPTGGSIILGCAYDVSNDGTFDARIKTTHGGFTGARTPYAEGTSMFSGTGNLRWVFADISSFQTASAQTIRLAMWIDNVGTGSSFTFDLDWFVVGTTPSNDLCNNPFNLINGLNGGTNGFYNSTASGLRPKSTSPDGINMGGAVTYVGSVDNGTVSIPQSGIPTIDGYEPTSSTNDGPFGSNTATIENSLWFSFTTPTDPTACGQAAGSSLRVDFTLPYLSCAANTAGAATFNQGIQGRVLQTTFVIKRRMQQVLLLALFALVQQKRRGILELVTEH